jgi:antitoxin component YwqK of YwqJK toxin-antitoxin module
MNYLLPALALTVLTSLCAAETVVLKDGSRLEALRVVDSGDNLSVETKYGNFLTSKTDVENLKELGFAMPASKGYPKTDGKEFYSEQLPDLSINVTYYESGKKIGAQLYSNTGVLMLSEGMLPDGSYREYYEDGKLKKEKSMIGGQNNGVFKIYYPDGTLQNEAYFIEGKTNGVYKVFSPTGALFLEKNYIKGVANGYSIEYDNAGKVKSQVLYVDGTPKLNEPPHKTELPAPHRASIANTSQKSLVFNFGGVTPQTKESDSNEEIGSRGLSWGVQSFKTRDNKVHFGLESAFLNFGDNTFDYGTAKFTFETSAIALSGIIKYSDNQANTGVRPMLFGGLGLGFFAAKAKMTPLPGYVWSNTNTSETRTIVSDSSVGYNLILGGGLEGDFNDKYFWNLAGRYTLIGVNIEDLDLSSVSSLQFNVGLGVKY